MTHAVTVTTRIDDEGTPDECRRVDQVKLSCDAAPDADCRRYPECDCESWRWDETGDREQYGHERVPGKQCILATWFEAEAACYADDDYDDMRDDGVPAIDRTGEIHVKWADEYPEWWFVPVSTDFGEAR